MPVDAADDGNNQAASSFEQAVRDIFRFRAGRTAPSGISERFERVFIALYDPGDVAHPAGYGDVCCFDVADPPPKVGRPPTYATCSLTEALRRIVADDGARNENVATWSDAAIADDEKLDLFEQAQKLANETPDDDA